MLIDYNFFLEKFNYKIFSSKNTILYSWLLKKKLLSEKYFGFLLNLAPHIFLKKFIYKNFFSDIMGFQILLLLVSLPLPLDTGPIHFRGDSVSSVMPDTDTQGTDTTTTISSVSSVVSARARLPVFRSTHIMTTSAETTTSMPPPSGLTVIPNSMWTVTVADTVPAWSVTSATSASTPPATSLQTAAGVLGVLSFLLTLLFIPRLRGGVANLIRFLFKILGCLALCAAFTVYIRSFDLGTTALGLLAAMLSWMMDDSAPNDQAHSRRPTSALDAMSENEDDTDLELQALNSRRGMSSRISDDSGNLSHGGWDESQTSASQHARASLARPAGVVEGTTGTSRMVHATIESLSTGPSSDPLLPLRRASRAASRCSSNGLEVVQETEQPQDLGGLDIMSEDEDIGDAAPPLGGEVSPNHLSEELAASVHRPVPAQTDEPVSSSGTSSSRGVMSPEQTSDPDTTSAAVTGSVLVVDEDFAAASKSSDSPPGSSTDGLTEADFESVRSLTSDDGKSVGCVLKLNLAEPVVRIPLFRSKSLMHFPVSHVGSWLAFPPPRFVTFSQSATDLSYHRLN